MLFRAAICAAIRWTMWNTIFLVAVVQAHNTNPYWRAGVHVPMGANFPCADAACSCSLVSKPVLSCYQESLMLALPGAS